MNKLYLFLIIFGIVFTTGSAKATVGGPTYISEIAFKVADNSVYYKVHDEGGRGCPPIVHKVDLATGKDTEVKSCTQFEEEYSYNQSGVQKYNQFVSNLYKDLSYLGSVSLLKNKIDVRVGFVSEYKMEGFDEPVWNNFLATITQDGREVGKINFKGCAKDQPHVFEGYMIPDSDKMGILISNEGDCFEGGYVKESLHMIQGVKYYDTNIIRSFKSATATEPNTGNTVVYAPTGENSLPLAPTSSDETKKSKVLYAIIAVILGLGLGYFFGRKIPK